MAYCERSDPHVTGPGTDRANRAPGTRRWYWTQARERVADRGPRMTHPARPASPTFFPAFGRPATTAGRTRPAASAIDKNRPPSGPSQSHRPGLPDALREPRRPAPAAPAEIIVTGSYPTGRDAPERTRSLDQGGTPCPPRPLRPTRPHRASISPTPAAPSEWSTPPTGSCPAPISAIGSPRSSKAPTSRGGCR